METAKPIGYGWRVGAPEASGVGGFYDLLGPNNYSVESGTFTKLREVSITYRLGAVRGIGGDWTARRRRPQPVHIHELLGLRSRDGRRTGGRTTGSGLDQSGRRVRLPDAAPVHVHTLHALLGAMQT